MAQARIAAFSVQTWLDCVCNALLMLHTCTNSVLPVLVIHEHSNVQLVSVRVVTASFTAGLAVCHCTQFADMTLGAVFTCPGFDTKVALSL